MKKQIEAENTMQDFISDRTVIDVLAYATTMCRPSMTARLKDMAEMHLKDNPYDLVFYIPIEFPLEKDGVRFEDDSYQKIIDLQILKYLKRYKIPYITLTGTLEERLKQIA
jgi:nicotinamide riboside kinase